MGTRDSFGNLYLSLWSFYLGSLLLSPYMSFQSECINYVQILFQTKASQVDMTCSTREKEIRVDIKTASRKKKKLPKEKKGHSHSNNEVKMIRTKKQKNTKHQMDLHIKFRPTCSVTPPSPHLLHLTNSICSQKIHSKIHYHYLIFYWVSAGINKN